MTMESRVGHRASEAKRHGGTVYGNSKGLASGSKKWYRSVFSGGKWDQFILGHAEGSVLQVCCGGSRIGSVRVDIDATVPGVNVVADMRHLPFRDEAFDTVACDPMYELGNDQRVHLQRELTRVAKARVLFKAPWIMRARGWQLVETVLMASHTCANVAVLSRLDRMHGDGLFTPHDGDSEPTHQPDDVRGGLADVGHGLFDPAR